MTTLRKIFVAATLAVSTLAPVATVEAAPLAMRDLTVDRQTDVDNVRWVLTCNRWGRRCRNVWRPHRVWIAPRVIIREPRYVYRRGYNAHVRWCLNRYRSYNPATNTYVGYDGYRHRCISPYS